jgi:RNA polymerase sigma-70 factor (ECF subfamily)
LRRLDLAEESLQDAFAVAVQRWPEEGAPRNPAGWLLTTARRRALDRLRREASDLRRLPLLVTEEAVGDDMGDIELDEGYAVPDERLRLVFTCCHPALSVESRVALTLRFVAGLSTPEIARLFLVSEPTMAARLTRAKKKIAGAGIPFRVPDATDLPERLAGALAVIYLVFTEGYAATSGDHLLRADLAGEAIRLGRVLRELMPGEPEVTALLALMVLHHARRRARLDSAGGLVLLGDQDRELWRWDEIGEGLTLLDRSAQPPAASPYALQAAIAAEHAKARQASDTDWPAIAALYGQLERLTGSAVVRLNRAVAVAEAAGPRAGLALLGGLDEALPRHHLLPAARAELLRRLGRTGEAITEYGRALDLVGNDVERSFLLSRRAELERAGGSDDPH